MLGEFDLIARHFAPLAAEVPGAFALGDDAAVIPPPAGADLVYTLDTIVAGVHWLPDDPPGRVAQKLLRVNLSDLAAMGARPLGYLLSTAFAQGVGEDWIAAFAGGLAADQDEFGIRLYGGDTTATPGPTTLTLTAVGAVPRGRALRRNAARAGDGVYVSGTIGDAALGLQAIRGEVVPGEEADTAFLAERYRLPRPRVALGQGLLDAGMAAAIDVSDGLIADLGHLCAQSGVAATLRAAAVPLSAAAQRLVERDLRHLATALTGGDDYELAFTVPAGQEEAVAALARRLELPLTRIGRIEAGAGVQVIDADGEAMALGAGGWRHF